MKVSAVAHSTTFLNGSLLTVSSHASGRLVPQGFAQRIECVNCGAALRLSNGVAAAECICSTWNLVWFILGFAAWLRITKFTCEDVVRLDIFHVSVISLGLY